MTDAEMCTGPPTVALTVQSKDNLFISSVSSNRFFKHSANTNILNNTQQPGSIMQYTTIMCVYAASATDQRKGTFFIEGARLGRRLVGPRLATKSGFTSSFSFAEEFDFELFGRGETSKMKNK